MLNPSRIVTAQDILEQDTVILELREGFPARYHDITYVPFCDFQLSEPPMVPYEREEYFWPFAQFYDFLRRQVPEHLHEDWKLMRRRAIMRTQCKERRHLKKLKNSMLFQ